MVHDIVEIDAGDTYCYDETSHLDKAAREKAAAERLFSMLPDDQGQEYWKLWQEFEAGLSPEACFTWGGGLALIEIFGVATSRW